MAGVLSHIFSTPVHGGWKRRASEVSQLLSPAYSITKRRSQHSTLYCNSNNYTNPLNNDSILCSVYQYLTFTDMLQCSSVNQQWYKLSQHSMVYENKFVNLDIAQYLSLTNRQITYKLNQFKHLHDVIQCIQLSFVYGQERACSYVVKQCNKCLPNMHTIKLSLKSTYTYSTSPFVLSGSRPFDSICAQIGQSSVTALHITYFDRMMDAITCNKQHLSKIEHITIIHTSHINILDLRPLQLLPNLRSVEVRNGGRVANESIVALSAHCAVNLTNDCISSRLNIHSALSKYARLQMFIQIQQACTRFDYLPIEEIEGATADSDQDTDVELY